MQCKFYVKLFRCSTVLPSFVKYQIENESILGYKVVTEWLYIKEWRFALDGVGNMD